MRLENKKIIVTAAAQGIGRSTAIRFASEGATVIATDINEEKLTDLNKENNKITTYKLDATNKSEVEKFCTTIDNVDILFHAVGFVHHGTLMDCNNDEFYRSINVNIYSAYLMCYNLLPKMLNKGKGNIIIISSAASSVKGAPNRLIYGTTKAALRNSEPPVARHGALSRRRSLPTPRNLSFWEPRTPRQLAVYKPSSSVGWSARDPATREALP